MARRRVRELGELEFEPAIRVWLVVMYDDETDSSLCASVSLESIAFFLSVQIGDVAVERGHEIIVLSSVELDRERKLLAEKVELKVAARERVAQPVGPHLDERMVRQCVAQHALDQPFAGRLLRAKSPQLR